MTLPYDGKPISEPGVYFGLPENLYFGADALGSSDYSAIWVDPPSWWWGSKYNSLAPVEEDEDGKTFGSAAHVCLLEGIERYEQLYAVIPKHTDHPDALRTTGQMQEWLRDAGLKSGGNKPVLVERIMNADPEAIIWDDLVMDALDGRIPLDDDKDSRLRLMRRVIESIPDIRDRMEGGASEVSIFWNNPMSGRLNRARVDRLVPRRAWDLKTFTRRHGVPPRLGALRHASNYLHHIQAAHYLDALEQVGDLVEAGLVYNATPEEQTLIEDVATKGVDFSWLFYPSNGAPLPFSIPIHEGLVLNEGASRLAEARQAFAKWYEVYGLDRMWLSAETEKPVDDEAEGFMFWRNA